THHTATEGEIDDAYCSHFIEHVPKGTPLITVMNEVHRVLKPGGSFTLVMPIVGYTDPFSGGPLSSHIGWQPWAGPAHVSFWLLPEAFLYFCEGPYKPNADYGMKIWAPLGSYQPEDVVSTLLEAERLHPAGHESFWSVRNGWEGVVRLVRP